MARKSRKNIPEVVSSATVQTEVSRPFRAGLYARISMETEETLRKRNDRNPGGIDEKLCSRYGRYFGCESL